MQQNIMCEDTFTDVNVFKCNLKELTTKSANSTRSQRSVWKHMCSSVAFCSCGVCPAVRGVLSASVTESRRHLALPRSLPFCCCFFSFFPLLFQCDGCLFFFLSLVHGGSWLGCSVVPVMGALFSLGTGCQKWKPLDTPGTQPPLSDAVVNL